MPKLEDRMLAVKEKLKDIISFIDKGANETKVEKKKVVQEEIKQLLEWQPYRKSEPY